MFRQWRMAFEIGAANRAACRLLEQCR